MNDGENYKTRASVQYAVRDWPDFLDKEQAQVITHLCMLGATEAELAAYFEVSTKAFNSWVTQFRGVAQAVRQGREIADAKVTASLFKSAIGYEHEDVHISNYMGQITETKIIRRYPPNAQSCMFWLKNRRPDLWKEKVDLEHSGRVETKETIDLSTLTQEQRDLLRSVLAGSNDEPSE